MKTFFAFIMLAFMAMSFTASPPEKQAINFDALFAEADQAFVAANPEMATIPANPQKIGYGYRKAVTLVSDTLVTIAPNNYTLTYATLALDTNAVITATVNQSIVGDRIILQITADGTNRQLDFTSPLIALDDSVVANKTKLFEFVFNGTNFVQLGELQIN